MISLLKRIKADKVKVLVVFCGGILLCLIYSTPQLLAYKGGYTKAYLLKSDEPSYLARMARVAQGYVHVGNPWTFENRNEVTVIPIAPEIFFGFISKITFLSIDTVSIIGRALFAFIGFILIFLMLDYLGVGFWLSFLAAFMIFSEPGVFYYKPFWGFLKQIDDLPFNRFTNPLFGLVTFLLAWLVGAKAVLSQHFDKRKSIAAGLLVALHFYVSIYYWTHLVLIFFLAVVFIKTEHRFKTFFVSVLTAIVAVIPYLFQAAKITHHPNYEGYAWRNGLFLKERGYYLLQHKTLWVFIVFSMALFFIKKSDQNKNRFVSLSVLAGVACYFSSVVTGVTLQNFHWHYTLAPLSFCALAVLISSLNTTSVLINKKYLYLMGLTVFLISAVSGFKTELLEYKKVEADHLYGIGSTDREYIEAWNWLKKNASKDDVVIASPQTMASVPYRTGLRIWQDYIMNLASFEDVFLRYRLLWYLEGISSDVLRIRMTPTEEPPIAQWVYGLPKEMFLDLKTRDYPILNKAQSAEIALLMTSSEKLLSKDDIVPKVKMFRANYLILGPNEAHWNRHRENVFVLENQGSFGKVRIERIVGWRN